MKEIIIQESIEQKIFLIRGQKVMIDRDLALLYNVHTKVLLQAVKRNKDRFPIDFMFQLNNKESLNLRSQFVTSSWGGRRYLPYVFTEQGIAMLSSVLKSKKAIQINIAIMRVFVKIRKIISTHKELGIKLYKLERKFEKHDKEIINIFEIISQLIIPKEKQKKRIGFKV
jgi:hypothetical protein